MEPSKAVLTADIVNSTLMEPKDLNDLILLIRSELKKEKVLFDFYRGDSFHALADMEQALSLALKLRVVARQMATPENKSPDIRIAIGLGNVDGPVKSMAMGKGEAFILSGRELDLIEKSSTHLSIRCSDEKIDKGMEAVSLIADRIIQEVSPKQAEVISELLVGATQMEIALKLRKSQSTINELAGAANWGMLEKAIEIYRKLVLYIEN